MCWWCWRVFFFLSWLDICIWPNNNTLTGIPGQSGPGSNDSEVVLYPPLASRTGASPSDNEIPRAQEKSENI